MHKYASAENLTLLQYVTKYKQYIDFEKLSARNYITRDIIDVYKDELSWELVSLHNDSLTAEDILAYKDYFDWKLLSENKGLNKDLEIKKLIKKQLEGES